MKTWVKIASAVTLFILIPAFVILFVYDYSSKNSSGEGEYASRIELKKTDFSCFEGERVEIPFRIKNSGTAVWSSGGPDPCFLSFHLLDETESTIQFDNRRFSFSKDIPPRETLPQRAGTGNRSTGVRGSGGRMAPKRSRKR